jgi:hypothetical protein
LRVENEEWGNRLKAKGEQRKGEKTKGGKGEEDVFPLLLLTPSRSRMDAIWQLYENHVNVP